MRPATMARQPTPPNAPSPPNHTGHATRASHLRNTWNLGLKEFRSLSRDLAMVFLIVFMFSASIYADARAKPESLSRAAIAVVDEDGSQLSGRIVAALQPPQFLPPEHVGLADMDRGLDAGRHTFVLDIPPNFQRDVLAGRSPALQLNIDATRQGRQTRLTRRTGPARRTTRATLPAPPTCATSGTSASRSSAVCRATSRWSS